MCAVRTWNALYCTLWYDIIFICANKTISRGFFLFNCSKLWVRPLEITCKENRNEWRFLVDEFVVVSPGRKTISFSIQLQWYVNKINRFLIDCRYFCCKRHYHDIHTQPQCVLMRALRPKNYYATKSLRLLRIKISFQIDLQRLKWPNIMKHRMNQRWWYFK